MKAQGLNPVHVDSGVGPVERVFYGRHMELGVVMERAVM